MKKPVDVLTSEVLSAYLKIPKSTLYKLVREGKVPCQKIGRHLLFCKVAIDRWLVDLLAKSSTVQAGTHGDKKAEETSNGGVLSESDLAKDRRCP